MNNGADSAVPPAGPTRILLVGDIRKAFVKPESLPKILIVTEKLLTGYDAPVLYCMYLDKPMKGHTLMQAIARANRGLSARRWFRSFGNMLS